MKRHGFIKVCAATPEIRVADVDFNVKNISDAAKKAAEGGAQLIVFPELCVTGYTCGDLFNQRALLSAAEEGIASLAKSLPAGALVFAGSPLEKDGRLYNCAFAFCGGAVCLRLGSATGESRTCGYGRRCSQTQERATRQPLHPSHPFRMFVAHRASLHIRFPCPRHVVFGVRRGESYAGAACERHLRMRVIFAKPQVFTT